MNQIEKANAFKAMHVAGAPVILYNVWDAGSAAAVVKAGASAIATGSWPVAAAQGYSDGQVMPMEEALANASRIIAAADVPVTIDFEGGYAEAPDEIAANVSKLIATGAIGLNFEDQIVGGEGLYPVNVQTARIKAVRGAADAAGIPMVINARTDLFLKAPDSDVHAALMDEAVARCAAYAEAGGDSFFAPGLSDVGLIGELCARAALPVNVMHAGPADQIPALAAAGVGRISHGPIPYRALMTELTARAKAAFDAK